MKCVTGWRRNTQMQLYKIEITDLAEQDLESAGDYIAFVLLNPGAAKNTVNGIRGQINKLQRFPESHEVDEDLELAKLGIRKTYYKEYKIFFMIDEENAIVYVIRILHMLVDSRAKLYSTFNLIDGGK